MIEFEKLFEITITINNDDIFFVSSNLESYIRKRLETMYINSVYKSYIIQKILSFTYGYIKIKSNSSMLDIEYSIDVKAIFSCLWFFKNQLLTNLVIDTTSNKFEEFRIYYINKNEDIKNMVSCIELNPEKSIPKIAKIVKTLNINKAISFIINRVEVDDVYKESGIGTHYLYLSKNDIDDQIIKMYKEIIEGIQKTKLKDSYSILIELGNETINSNINDFMEDFKNMIEKLDNEYTLHISLKKKSIYIKLDENKDIKTYRKSQQSFIIKDYWLTFYLDIINGISLLDTII